ncbi:sensor domain-containing diguanylate cyclase [uncultured Tolumonas sp.]|uniref:GGDEF domain-containing protein n=1 Tax=uncultured Tolumonas sp. TaxID=263765 RepID=UPI00292DA8B1|nr:sensor domain-containing diguanylate cyclase [uncultured Tolumonas sp.]
MEHVNTRCNVTKGQLLEIIALQTNVVQQGLDLASIMQMVTRETQRLTHADGAVIELSEAGEMVYRAVSGLAENQLGLRLPMANSLSGYVVEVGKTLVCYDSEQDERVNREACNAVGLRSMIVNPLKFRDENIGVLKILYKRPNAFAHKDIEIVKLLSDLIAASMHTATEYGVNELYIKATTDQLTGVSNRALFFDRLRRIILESQRSGEIFGIVIFDMDSLKQINDHLGHRAGDAAIKEVALRVNTSIREYDTLSRLGGDEFGIILNKIHGIEDAKTLYQRITTSLNHAFIFEKNNIPLHVSIGYSIFDVDGKNIEELIEVADRRMYKEKEAKRIVNKQL